MEDGECGAKDAYSCVHREANCFKGVSIALPHRSGLPTPPSKQQYANAPSNVIFAHGSFDMQLPVRHLLLPRRPHPMPPQPALFSNPRDMGVAKSKFHRAVGRMLDVLDLGRVNEMVAKHTE